MRCCILRRTAKRKYARAWESPSSSSPHRCWALTHSMVRNNVENYVFMSDYVWGVVTCTIPDENCPKNFTFDWSDYAQVDIDAFSSDTFQAAPTCQTCVRWSCEGAAVSECMRLRRCRLYTDPRRADEPESRQLQRPVRVQLPWTGPTGGRLSVSADLTFADC